MKERRLDAPVLLFEEFHKYRQLHTDGRPLPSDPVGTVTNRGLEMAGPAQLVRQGWKRDTMKIGDAVTVDVSRARDGGTHAYAQVVVPTSTGQRLLGGPPQGR